MGNLVPLLFTSEEKLYEKDRVRQADGIEVGMSGRAHVLHFMTVGFFIFLITIFAVILIAIVARPNVSDWIDLIPQNYAGYGQVFIIAVVVWVLACSAKASSTIYSFAGIYTYASAMTLATGFYSCFGYRPLLLVHPFSIC